MSDIQFDEERQYARPSALRQPRGIIALVMKWGLAKDSRQAGHVLIGVAVIAAVLAFVIPVFFGGHPSVSVSQSKINAAMSRTTP